jgi:hypothetical protein
MNERISFKVLGFVGVVLSLFACSGSHGGSGAAEEDDCMEACAKEVGLPNCNSSTCLNNCSNPQGLPPQCESDYVALLDCTVTIGQITGCNTTGGAVVVGCDGEENTLLACVGVP